MFRLVTRIASAKELPMVIVVLLLIGAGPLNILQPRHVVAAELSPRSIKLSDSRATLPISHQITLQVTTSGPIGSIAIQYCSNSPLEEDPCTPPAGFDASGAVLVSQSGEIGFSIYSGSTANIVILTRPPVLATGGTTAMYLLNNVVSQTNDGTLYARILTYPSSDGTGSATDSGGLALMILPAPTISAEVPPFLLFCLGESITAFDCGTATEPFSDVGILSPLVTGAAQSQLLVATNAENGYTMWALGGTMTSGNNILPAMAGGPSQKGVNQFGINLRANTAPVIGQDPVGPGVATIMPGYDQQDQFRYQSGDALSTASAPDDFRKYTVSYIVNVAAGQPGGVYATTITYVTLANF